jgi:hypothetical protein
MAEIVAAWPAVVGEAIARNACPARLARDGTLHVATSSSSWSFELAQLEPKLLARLREALSDGVPRRLRFAVGRVPEVPTEAPPNEQSRFRAPSGEARAQADKLAAGVEDEELRALIARAASASLARAASGRVLW